MHIISAKNKIVLGMLCMIILKTGHAQGVTVKVVPPDGMHRGNSYTVPIQVTNFNNVNTFQFDVLFNTANIELAQEPSASFLGRTTYSTDLLTSNVNGRVTILWLSPVTPLNFGNGELLDLKFNVRLDATIGGDSIGLANGIVTDVLTNSLNPTFYSSSINILTGVKENSSPQGFYLHQNYPNPFNPSTTIRYQVQTESFVKLIIFDMVGNEVAMLVNEKQQAGNYAVPFNTLNGSLSSGVYFYKLDAGTFHQIRKMILIK